MNYETEKKKNPYGGLIIDLIFSKEGFKAIFGSLIFLILGAGLMLVWG